MSLYLKYRPADFNELKGNTDIIASLEKMLSSKENCPHSFLLSGPTGTGKTTIARIIAKKLGCEERDFVEVDSGQFRGIDTIREIRDQSQYMPIEGSCRMWVIDEAHRLTSDAQNALLKILEDSPSHVYFVLCTTDPQKLIETVKGRCIHFKTSLLSDSQMQGLMFKIVRSEGFTLSDEIYEQIILDSLGHARNAIQILEAVLSVPEEKRLKIARQTAERQSQVIELCRALIKHESWSKIALILSGLKDQEAESIRRAVIGYCQAILLKERNEGAAEVLHYFIGPFYDSGFPQLILAAYYVTKK